MKKRFVVYDLPEEISAKSENDVLFPANPMVKKCNGCFNCWIKTPGRCVINDRCLDVPSYLAGCDEFVLITPVLYGGYSAEVKAVIDRSIPYILPYMRIVNGEMHHTLRHNNLKKFTVIFYGEYDAEEKDIAESVVKANAINFGAKKYEVKFCTDGKEAQSCLY